MLLFCDGRRIVVVVVVDYYDVAALAVGRGGVFVVAVVDDSGELVDDDVAVVDCGEVEDLLRYSGGCSCDDLARLFVERFGDLRTRKSYGGVVDLLMMWTMFD
jgi:hypothetical protein